METVSNQHIEMLKKPHFQFFGILVTSKLYITQSILVLSMHVLLPYFYSSKHLLCFKMQLMLTSDFSYDIFNDSFQSIHNNCITGIKSLPLLSHNPSLSHQMHTLELPVWVMNAWVICHNAT